MGFSLENTLLSMRESIRNFRFNNVIDILIIAFIVYQLYELVKQTRAEQLAKGLVILLVVTKLSEWFKLYTLRWLLNWLLGAGLIAIVVIFQPEIRRAFESIGRSKIIGKRFGTNSDNQYDGVIEEIVQACNSLSRQKIGALIVFQRQTGFEDIIETGTKIDGLVSMGLLINIFIPNTPLHDGAVIVDRDIVKAAACFLPITDNNRLSKELGTRHRAALGISERSDCMVIVVSEETGGISCCENGEIARYLDEETLRKKLREVYDPKEEKLGFIAKIKGEFNEAKEKEEQSKESQESESGR
ncbi:diadenylate cyclase CdaA [uncultured Ezakiella sp.]|uniref:diadenylate cyclase CdaA n=1 Tax=uncultured Ezakiella sp. TaxID=1637529 RepID=UPI0025EA0B6C|nr:diadenylate cyclase CdaA [uncultured Ezakiella sp.]